MAKPAAKDGRYTEQFLASGVTVLGKSRMPEFGLNASTEFRTGGSVQAVIGRRAEGAADRAGTDLNGLGHVVRTGGLTDTWATFVSIRARRTPVVGNDVLRTPFAVGESVPGGSASVQV